MNINQDKIGSSRIRYTKTRGVQIPWTEKGGGELLHKLNHIWDAFVRLEKLCTTNASEKGLWYNFRIYYGSQQANAYYDKE